MYSLLVLSLFVGLVNSNAVSFIQKCHAADSKCLKENFEVGVPILAKGIPELKIAPLDPLHITRVDASRQNLKFIVSDGTITGLSNCKPRKVARPEKGKLSLKFQCELNLKGQYEMEGNLLILHIQGNGPAHSVLRKMVISAELDVGEKVGKDGKMHWDIKRSTHSYTLEDKADLEFGNLFDGNEDLSRAVKNLLATNANDVVTEIGDPIFQVIVKEIIKSVNKLFHAVPIEDLTLDY